jgi:hypothetical protein
MKKFTAIYCLALSFVALSATAQTTNEDNNIIGRVTEIEVACVSTSVYCKTGKCAQTFTTREKISTRLDRIDETKGDMISNFVVTDLYEGQEIFQNPDHSQDVSQYRGFSKTYFLDNKNNGTTTVTTDAYSPIEGTSADRISDSYITVFKSSYETFSKRNLATSIIYFKENSTDIANYRKKQNVVIDGGKISYELASYSVDGVTSVRKVTCTEKLLSEKDYRWQLQTTKE